MMKRRSLLIGLAMAAFAATSAAHAGTWPERPITLIVPFAAGGSTDVAARLLAEKLGAELGQTIIVENRPGAGSNLGAAYVAKSAPDGYTLLLATSTLAANVSLYKRMGFDLQKDLVPVSQLTRIPNVLTINNNVPARTLPEFIDYVRRNKGSVNFGSSGNGASQHLSAELFKKMAQVDMVHVPYKGGALATNDLIAGHIQVVFAPLVEVLSHIQAGTLRALAVTTRDRVPLLPELPTMTESMPGFEVALWNGLFVPNGTPPAIIDRLSALTQKVMTAPAVQKQVSEQGSTVVVSSSGEFKTFLGTEIEKWGGLVKLSGAQID
ncbi:tripartite tricarboxylate transporter substrate binding protein [Bradyrhizobium sp. AUGA SZCCT0431]|nr:tripartite tricarboxylate transporter substrate binding protein [Bradyrhizobium sp. AUGA SZCCT0431]